MRSRRSASRGRTPRRATRFARGVRLGLELSGTVRVRHAAVMARLPAILPRARGRRAARLRHRAARPLHVAARGLSDSDRRSRSSSRRGAPLPADAAPLLAARAARPVLMVGGHYTYAECRSDSGCRTRSGSRATTTTGSATSRRASSRRSSRARCCCGRSPLAARQVALLPRDERLPRVQRALRADRVVDGADRRARPRPRSSAPRATRGTRSGTCSWRSIGALVAQAAPGRGTIGSSPRSARRARQRRRARRAQQAARAAPGAWASGRGVDGHEAPEGAIRRPDMSTDREGAPAVGRSIPRVDGVAKVTGAARYVDDLDVPGRSGTARTVRTTCAARRAARRSSSIPAFDWTRRHGRDRGGHPGHERRRADRGRPARARAGRRHRAPRRRAGRAGRARRPGARALAAARTCSSTSTPLPAGVLDRRRARARERAAARRRQRVQAVPDPQGAATSSRGARAARPGRSRASTRPARRSRCTSSRRAMVAALGRRASACIVGLDAVPVLRAQGDEGAARLGADDVS